MSNVTNPTVKAPAQPCPPCPDALRWSTSRPTAPGYYFLRGPNPSNTGWQVHMVRIGAPQPGMKLAVYLDSVTAHAMTLDHPNWDRYQWSDRALTEPTGG